MGKNKNQCLTRKQASKIYLLRCSVNCNQSDEKARGGERQQEREEGTIIRSCYFACFRTVSSLALQGYTVLALVLVVEPVVVLYWVCFL